MTLLSCRVMPRIFHEFCGGRSIPDLIAVVPDPCHKSQGHSFYLSLLSLPSNQTHLSFFICVARVERVGASASTLSLASLQPSRNSPEKGDTRILERERKSPA